MIGRGALSSRTGTTPRQQFTDAIVAPMQWAAKRKGSSRR